jgi:hypothetical protein
VYSGCVVSSECTFGSGGCSSSTMRYIACTPWQMDPTDRIQRMYDGDGTQRIYDGYMGIPSAQSDGSKLAQGTAWSQLHWLHWLTLHFEPTYLLHY